MPSSFPRILSAAAISLMLPFYAANLRAEDYALISLPDGSQLNAEIAASPSAKEYGLMHRLEMPADEAMLFVYDDMDHRAVWMKNTLIALDVLFLSDTGRVVDLKPNLQPCIQSSCPIYPSTAPARYILEMNAGVIERSAVKSGDALTIDYRHKTQ